MNRNILRAAIATSLLGISGATFAADNINVPFSGTVGNICTASNITAGTVGLKDAPPADNTMLTSDPAQASAGTLGSFDLTCTAGTATLTVATPAESSADATTLASAGGYGDGAEIYDAASTLLADTAGTATSNGNADGTYSVSMWATTAAAIPPGIYNYTVNVTITDE